MDAAVRARVALPRQRLSPKRPTSSLESGEVPPSPKRAAPVPAPSLSDPTTTRKKRKKKRKKRTPVSNPSTDTAPASHATATPSPASSAKPDIIIDKLPVGVQLYDADDAPSSTNDAMRRLLRQPRSVVVLLSVCLLVALLMLCLLVLLSLCCSSLKCILSPRSSRIILRYFDQGDITTPSGPRCYRCGGVGHLARNCTRDESIRPCHLCAQMGHEAQDCPNSMWHCGAHFDVDFDVDFDCNVSEWSMMTSSDCTECCCVFSSTPSHAQRCVSGVACPATGPLPVKSPRGAPPWAPASAVAHPTAGRPTRTITFGGWLHGCFTGDTPATL